MSLASWKRRLRPRPLIQQLEIRDLAARALAFEDRLRRCLRIICGAHDAAAVELVVPGNVKYRFGKTGCPGSRLPRARDVPRQDYRIGVIPRYLQCAEAEMQVRQNIEFHKFWMHCENAGMFAGNPIPFSGRRTLCGTLRTRPER